MDYDKKDVTLLLHRLKGGDRKALDQLFPIVYDDLHRRAQGELRRESNATISTTGLVHEAYFRLVDHHDSEWEGRSHFFAVASRAMRQVLVQRARRRHAEKRGGRQRPTSLSDVNAGAADHAEAILVVNQALEVLDKIDKRQAQVVECRFFGGMTVQETAEALDVSPSTVKRDWRIAKLWLSREMRN